MFFKMSIKLAIALGNTGAEYAATRHNAGRISMVCLAKTAFEKTGSPVKFVSNKYCGAELAKIEIEGRQLILACAYGYMNESGVNLKNILKFLKLDISETAVMCDDINLEIGRAKISKGGSAGGHNGIKDIMERCGNDFVRVRIGVGGKVDKRMNLADHVLGKLSPEDISAIESVEIWECFKLLLTKGLEAAQNVMNRTKASEDNAKRHNHTAIPPKADTASIRPTSAHDILGKEVVDQNFNKQTSHE